MSMISYYFWKREQKGLIKKELWKAYEEAFRAKLKEAYDYVDSEFLWDYGTFAWESLDHKQDVVESDLKTAKLIKVGQRIDGEIRYVVLVNPFTYSYKEKAFQRYIKTHPSNIEKAVYSDVRNLIIPCVYKSVTASKFRVLRLVDNPEHGKLKRNKAKRMGWCTFNHNIILSNGKVGELTVIAIEELSLMAKGEIVQANFKASVECTKNNIIQKQEMPKTL